MSAPLPAKVIGAVLLGAALAGIAVITVVPTLTTREAAEPPAVRADTQRQTLRVANVDEAVDRLAPVAGALPLPPPRIEIASPLDSAATDSAPPACVMRLRLMLSDSARDSSGIEVMRVRGIRPEPGRGPDTLVVEGTAHGRDATPAVWHCALLAKRDGGIARLTAVIEDGWPGVSSAYDSSHAVTVAIVDACLQQTKKVYPEYDFRGVRSHRDLDTLHVTGEAMPMNTGDLAGDFHCRAVVHDGHVTSMQAKAER